MILFASDLDGTLLNSNHELDDYIVEGIRKVRENGDQLVPVSGRQPEMIDFLDFGGPKWSITMNGAAIFNPEGECVIAHPFEKEALKELLETNEPLMYSDTKSTYTPVSKEKWTASAKASGIPRYDGIEKTTHFDVPADEILEKQIVKATLFNDGEKPELMEIMDRHHIVNQPSIPMLFEFTKEGVNKASGIRELQKYLQADEVYVFGDSNNDLQMLEAFENSYVPAISTPEAKKAGHHQLEPGEHAVIDFIVNRSNQAAVSKKKS